ncbi:clostripain-related cysteine peptidase [Planctomicrobium piriforme]|uniref:Pre-peptidase C-terminal domain-containing protein n=1 Tax=Planctomicrobium piriforme TaxID=1576369 RepID=A0A1I3B534_9PLAN|nr:clostripain-related cysteine peptidase [Planctomicrobium piriforme]SFH57310.1 pre-peptidase C-terminal domain-containing protein [Planctomicrobium piriforme]
MLKKFNRRRTGWYKSLFHRWQLSSTGRHSNQSGITPTNRLTASPALSTLLSRMRSQWAAWLISPNRRTSRFRHPWSAGEMLEIRQLLSASISGTAFDDANGNGLQEPGEQGLAGQTVRVEYTRDFDYGSLNKLFRGGQSATATITPDTFFTPNAVVANVIASMSATTNDSINDLTVTLTHGSQTVRLYNGESSGSFINATFDDNAILDIDYPFTRTSPSGTFIPYGGNHLSTFNGSTVSGSWQLKITDEEGYYGALLANYLTGFTLSITYADTVTTNVDGSYYYSNSYPDVQQYDLSVSTPDFLPTNGTKGHLAINNGGNSFPSISGVQLGVRQDNANETQGNTLATAIDLGTLSGSLTIGPDAIAAGGDQDWYKFTLDRPAVFGNGISLEFNQELGDLDVELYDSSGVRLNFDLTSTGRKWVPLVQTTTDSAVAGGQHINPFAAGTYYVKIIGRSHPVDSSYYAGNQTVSDSNAAYTLRVDGPGPDAFDQTGNNTPAKATNFAATASSTDGTFQLSGLSLDSPGDVDWFRIQAAAPLIETNNWFQVNYDSSLGNLVLELYDSTGRTRLGRSNVIGDRLEIRDLTAPAGSYLLKVSSAQGAAISNYSLQTLYPVTVGDRFDQADGTGDGINLGMVQGDGKLSNLVMLSNDFFSFTTTTVGQAGDYIGIDFNGQPRNVYGQLFDPEFNWHDLEVLGNSLRFSLEGLPAGSYSFYLNSFDEFGLPNYSASWQAPTLAHKDWAEMATPRLFRPLGAVAGELTWDRLSLTSDDAYDAYTFSLGARGTSTDFARIQFDNARGDLSLSLYFQPTDQNGNWVGQPVSVSKSFSQQNVEQISLSGLNPGQYLLVVNAASTGGENSDYSLTIHAPPLTRTDRFESNDVVSTATDLGNLVGTRTIERLSSTLDNRDVFKIHLSQAGTAADLVRIDFNYAYGDLKLGLVDANNNLVSASTQMGGRQELSLAGLPLGDYYIVVQARFAVTRIPGYRLTLQGPSTATYNDWSETIDGRANNNSVSAATSLGVVRGTNVWSNVALTGSADRDYFKFTLAEEAVSGNQVALKFDLSHGDIQIDLLNASGNVLRTIDEPAELKKISLEGLAAGTYYIRIMGTGFSQAWPYSLQIAAPGGRQNSDHLEPNNTRELATDLGAVQTMRTWGTDGPGPLSLDTGSDEDWYKFRLTAQAVQGHFAQISFDSSQGDLSLELYDQDGNLVDSSKTFSDREWINLSGMGSDVAKTYYLRVFSADGKAQPAYSLTISAPGFDQSEGPDTLYTYLPSGFLPVFFPQSGSYSASNLSIESDDSDWFYFQLPSNPVEGDAATISFSHLQGDLRLDLYTNYNGSPIRSSNGTGDSERISLTGLSSSVVYYLKVSGVDGARNPNYQLQINTTPALAADGIDLLPAEQATPYPLYQVQGLYTVHSAYFENRLSIHNSTDVDTFSFTMSSNATASHFVQAAFNHFAGDIDLELYDSTGTVLLGRSATAGNVETISLDGLPARDDQGNLIEYRVKVFGDSGSTNPYYSLTFNTPAPIFSDWAEANNSASQAKDLRGVEGDLTLSGLSLHQAGDLDYFKFQLAAPGIVGTGLTLSSDVGYGTLGLTLYSSNGSTILANSQIYSGTQFISFAGLAAGTYYIRVQAANGTSTVPQYKLNFVAPQSKGDWSEDSSTRGDTRQTAYDLQTAKGDMSWYNLSIHSSSDDDWFAFQLDADAVAGHFVEIITNYQLGDLDLELYDSDGIRLNAATSEDVERVSLDGLKAKIGSVRQTYYLRVVGYRGGTQPNYTLRINAPESGLNGDAIDARSSNNTFATATPLMLNGGAESIGGLSIHQSGDVDFFRFTMPATGAPGSLVAINFDNAQGDLQLQLLDASGQAIPGRSSNGQSGTEAISLNGLAMGETYYVKVSIAGGAVISTQPDYSLTFVTPTDPQPDRLEGNSGNDTFDTASGLREVSGQVSIARLSLTSGDTDFFRFTLLSPGQAGDVIQTLTNITSGRLQLRLYRSSNRTSEIAISNTGFDVQELSLEGLTAGDYFLRVTTVNNVPVGDYSLAITAPTKLQPDSAEGVRGNNGLDTAFELGNVAEVPGRPIPGGAADGLPIRTFDPNDPQQLELFNSYYDAYNKQLAPAIASPAYTVFRGVVNPNAGINAESDYGYLDGGFRNLISQAKLDPTLSVWGGLGYNSGSEMDSLLWNLTPAWAKSNLAGIGINQNQPSPQQLQLQYQQLQLQSLQDQAKYQQQLQYINFYNAKQAEFDQQFRMQQAQYQQQQQNIANQIRSGSNLGTSYGGFTANQLGSFLGLGFLNGAPMASGLAPVAVLPGLSINTPDDQDWFHFDLTQVGRDDDFARIAYVRNLGGLKLTLYVRAGDGTLTEVEQSSTQTGTEEISLDRLQPGSYYVKIEGENGAMNPDYQLEFSLQQPAKEVRADWSEPSNMLATARDLRTIEGTHTFDGLNLHKTGDEDWFALTTTDRAQPDDFIDVRFSENYGDVDIELYDAGGNLISSSTGTTGIEHLPLKAANGTLLPAGKYYVRVFGNAGATSPGYQLTIAATGSTVEADALEYNNTLDLATDLNQFDGLRQLTGLTIQSEAGSSSADEDWFKFTLASSGRASDKLWIDFDNTRGALKIELYNSNGGRILGFPSPTELSLSGIAAGTYYARVVGASTSDSNRYTLNYELQPKVTSDQDDWTIFVYMTAGDLAKYAQQDINELEQAAARLSSSVNLVVLLDQSPDGAFATGGDSQSAWAGAGMAVIQPDLNGDKIATRFLPASGSLATDVNSASSQTLQNFLVWGAQAAPAQKYGLIFWNHGNAFSGSNLDTDTGTTDKLQISEMLAGINSAKSQLGALNLQFISFDACHMQTLEVAQSLGSAAPVVVGSEELETSEGSNYASAFAVLQQNPGSVTGQQLAGAIVHDYGLRNRSNVHGADTLSAVDAASSAMTDLLSALKSFTNAVSSINPGGEHEAALRAAILSARDAATAFSRRSDLRDLRQFLNNVISRTNDNPALSGVRDAAASAIEELDHVVLSKTQDQRSVGGLSIYWPGPGDQIDPAYLTEYATFLTATGWGTFLQRYTTGLPTSLSPVQPDWAEGNNSFARAFNLGDVFGTGNLYTGLSLSAADDVDWYRFRSAKGTDANSRITFATTQAGANVTLELYRADAPGAVLKVASSSNGKITLQPGTLPAGEYLLRVASDSQAILSSYWLVLSTPAATTTSVLESNVSGNHSREKAHSLGAVATSANFSGLAIQGTSTDWYSFTTPRSHTNAAQQSGFVSIRIPGGKSAQASLWSSDGAQLQTTQGRGMLTFTYDVAAGRTYFLSVERGPNSGSTAAPVSYAIQFNNDSAHSPSLNLRTSSSLVSSHAGNTLTVTRADADLTQALTVNLSATPGNLLQLPASVTIPAGSLSVTISLPVVSPLYLIQPKSVTIKATAAGLQQSSLPVTVMQFAPGIAGFDGNISYTEGNSGILLDSDVTVTDPDSSDLAGGKLTVSLVGGKQSTDVLSIRTVGSGANQVTTSGNQVLVGGTIIGNCSGGTSNVALSVTLNANATPALVQKLLRAVAFSSTSRNISTLPRTVQVTLTDGDGGTSAAVSKMIAVTAVNDAPVLAAIGDSVEFAGPAPVLIDSDAKVTDPDSADFNGGKLTVTLSANVQSSDVLSIRHQGTATGMIGVNGSDVAYGGVVIGTFSGGTNKVALVIAFNANATTVGVQALLRSLQFSNASPTRSTAPRTVRFLITDGDGGTSAAAYNTVTFSPLAP